VPFWALVEALTGDVLDVVESLDEEAPPGVIVIELPARDDDVRIWLAKHRRKKAGASARELVLEKEDVGDDAKNGGRRDEMRDAEQFFARLEQELLRGEIERRRFSVLLFDLHPVDRPLAQEFVLATLTAHNLEFLPTDFVARLRDHAIGVILQDTDTRNVHIVPERGFVTSLNFPEERGPLAALRRRRHPLLRKSVYRG
jgi:hypothetical protein